MNKSTAYANANIALIKYWGKSDVRLNVPAVPSISMTLSHLGTTVTVESIDKNHELSDPSFKDSERARLFKYLELVREFFPYDGHLRITSKSSIPVSAGLASSASFFAALATALNDHFSLKLAKKELSILARMGSASAARSIFGGFCALGYESHEDAYAYELKSDLDVAMVIAVVDQGPKKISSREAMNITANTSPFFDNFVKEQPKDFDKALAAIKDGDFLALGKLMEHSTLKMFATMWTALPAINYWKPESLGLINLVYELRNELGAVFFTMDAGPNVKILCPSELLPQVLSKVARSGLTVDIRSSALGQGAQIINEHLS